MPEMVGQLEPQIGALHVWCDASCDPPSGLAFGAFMMRGMDSPQLVKLKSKTSRDAEFETMTRALAWAPLGCVIMTDLIHWTVDCDRWNYHVVRMFREAVEKNGATVRYVTPAARSIAYHLCHHVAVTRLRKELGKCVMR